jgi:hypothetical protein
MDLLDAIFSSVSKNVGITDSSGKVADSFPLTSQSNRVSSSSAAPNGDEGPTRYGLATFPECHFLMHYVVSGTLGIPLWMQRDVPCGRGASRRS